jgi:hypothetical protein
MFQDLLDKFVEIPCCNLGDPALNSAVHAEKYDDVMDVALYLCTYGNSAAEIFKNFNLLLCVSIHRQARHH